jgi:hypothetical protein
MKLSWMAALLFAFIAVDSSAQQTSVPEAVANKIIVQLLNGKNGKPIKRESPNIWLGNAKDPTNPQTDSKGEILLEIKLSGNYYVDCRLRGNRRAAMNVKYSLNEVVSKGIVTENDCGKSRVDPIPGRLVLYLRPMTFVEKWGL